MVDLKTSVGSKLRCGPRLGVTGVAILALSLTAGCDPCMNNPCNDGLACNGVETCAVESDQPICGNGVPVVCSTDETCTEPDGTCLAPDPCDGVTCADGTSCVDGICMDDQPADPCADVTCATGETCVDGSCVADQPAGGDAAAGELFFTSSGCVACHLADGTGLIGPNIVGRDAATVLNVLTVQGEHGIGLFLPDTTQQDADDIAAFLGSL